MAKKLNSGEKQFVRVLKKVENTATLIRAEIVQLGGLTEVLDHWGGLIRVTQVMGKVVFDSEQWVDEINQAIKAMRKRHLFAAQKLRSMISKYEKNSDVIKH
jgi:hypothetical protein